jgi:high-affinity iron transporter
MFGAALIIFRETLEAALFISIMAVATRGLPERGRWLAGGITAGVVGSLTMAALIGPISQMAEGIGQEFLNAGILATAFVMLAWHVISSARHGAQAAGEARQLGESIRAGVRTPWALAVAVALSVLREGAETVLFVAGYATSDASGHGEIFAGCALGLLAGAATGAMLYAGLTRIPLRRLFAVTNGLILLLAAAMASQLARTLIQAGVLPGIVVPLWDTSQVLPMDSVPGMLLHALIGYDARPSAMQLLFYATGVLLIFGGMRWMRPVR